MTKQTGSGKNPLASLKPLVVDHTGDYGIRITLGADVISREQRDAALSYLTRELSNSDDAYRLESSAPGQPFMITGNTSEFVGSIGDRLNEVVRPEYRYSGELQLKTVRNRDRRKIGVEATLRVKVRGFTAKMPVLEELPPQVLRLNQHDQSVTFSLRNPGREDAKLIKAALKVAAAYGIYIATPPRAVQDTDSDAKLFPEFDYRD